MKILLVMDPGILVPPQGYGGIERIVEIMAKEYLKHGHEVHLLVTKGSAVAGCIVHPFGKEGFPPKKKDAMMAIPFAWQFLWKNRKSFDMIHNFGRLAYLLPILSFKVKKVMTYEREITRANIVHILRYRTRNLFFTGCSKDLVSRADAPGQWQAVHNGIDFNAYTLNETINEEAPLIFLGRIEKIKGCHFAIKVAIATGNKLIIAGNISTLEEEKIYFKEEIEPFIDNDQIRYIGAVNDLQKNEWLGKSKAMLFPILWNEPFGIVMIEAMACGTPVIGFKHGSVDEVIDEGITGLKVNTIDEMITAVKDLNIDRRTCRSHAQKRFDASVIAKQYLNLN